MHASHAEDGDGAALAGERAGLAQMPDASGSCAGFPLGGCAVRRCLAALCSRKNKSPSSLPSSKLQAGVRSHRHHGHGSESDAGSLPVSLRMQSRAFQKVWRKIVAALLEQADCYFCVASELPMCSE